jgi:copper(I)-binding protein
MNVSRGMVLPVLAAALALLPSNAEASPAIVVSGVWSRPATDNAVVYCTIRNGGRSADALIGAASPQAEHTELHETVTGAGTQAPMAGMPMASMVSMRSVASAAVPAGGRLELQPGGYHLMLIGVKQRWKTGDSFTIRLHFKQAGWISANGIVSSGQ